MTTDSTLSYQPTESLVLPTKRRFFPFRIPNYHQQLRHYISTADQDRIYVVVDRVVYSIHISSRKRETVAVIPFEPKCLAAGYGWIGIGGTTNGECAFVKLSDCNGSEFRETPAAQAADVDSALPIDLVASQRSPPRASVEAETINPSPGDRPLPEVQLHKFGGTIVNSVTIHRLPGDETGFMDEDVAVLSNNDKTVTIYSITRSKVLKKICHPACMNYAIISPDSSILAAVGDEANAYFYGLTRDFSTVVSAEAGGKLSGWALDLLLCIEMEIGPRIEDRCCFTIAFSQSNRLCAIGSQSGVISVFDVRVIQGRSMGPSDESPIVCYFNSSRPPSSGGAVRCMSFAPEPWDLLVWLEDRGRAGIADVRQAFVRRQILQLDMNEPAIEEVETEPIVDESTGLGFDLDIETPPESQHDLDARAILDSIEGHAVNRRGESDASTLQESMIQDLTERERLVMEFLNTARWTSRFEDGLTDRLARGNVNSHPHSGSRARHQGPTSGANRAPRPTSPRPVILSQSNLDARNTSADMDSSTPDPQPSITLSWTASPGELESATLANPTHTTDSSSSDQSGSSNESGNSGRHRGTITRPSVNFDYSSSIPLLPGRNHQRSRSVHRRSERQDNSLDVPHNLRANILAVERLRRQRLINEAEALSRNSLREQRYNQQSSFGFDQSRSSRWIRSVINDPPERSYGMARRDSDPSSSAGLGFGVDGRSLYIATVTGIFEYQINIMDRKTFPVITYR
ncbi:uncharacterized protein DSM5745_02445 [Aspergillus mulundensis]|uniref:DUF2415 domain-containing protein n=1 Tax=Aspergillus mulundensis TaxID=1810919 RepID=A0A3D8SWK7_9EURO|nr:Uncharacterized protein DSM5745_02445 [Aspergillus mulundensis]RDW90670.1 Uncharacterized protein DSM5745_02445 [Aspergillus mulundensis]